MPTLQEQFGQIDIYVFDQLLRGNIKPGMRVLDAGCGSGRNLVYLLREGYEVFAADHDPAVIEHIRNVFPTLPASHVRLESLDVLSFPDATFDVIICNTVLHFSRDDAHFDAMLHNLWRVLKPGGVLFSRLASTIGMPHKHVRGRRYLAPEGTDRFCVDEAFLMQRTATLNAELVDPIKTTVVQNQRCMTTWVIRKPAS